MRMERSFPKRPAGRQAAVLRIITLAAAVVILGSCGLEASEIPELFQPAVPLTFNSLIFNHNPKNDSIVGFSGYEVYYKYYLPESTDLFLGDKSRIDNTETNARNLLDVLGLLGFHRMYRSTSEGFVSLPPLVQISDGETARVEFLSYLDIGPQNIEISIPFPNDGISTILVGDTARYPIFRSVAANTYRRFTYINVSPQGAERDLSDSDVSSVIRSRINDLESPVGNSIGLKIAFVIFAYGTTSDGTILRSLPVVVSDTIDLTVGVTRE